MSTTNTKAAELAGVATTWAIDSAHSSVDFSVRHLIIATVKGAFQRFEGTIWWDGEHLESASVETRIETQGITTHNQLRDDHLRSADFLHAEKWPVITFKSTRIEPTGRHQFMIHGDLTIRDNTRPAALAAEYLGQIRDGEGMQRAAFTGMTSIDRKEFGINWNQRLESGGVVVGDTVKVTLYISAVRQNEATHNARRRPELSG